MGRFYYILHYCTKEDLQQGAFNINVGFAWSTNVHHESFTMTTMELVSVILIITFL